MEGIKSPDVFDFSCSNSNKSERWRRYEQSLRLYLTAVMGTKSERERCAAVLYIIGEEGREIFYTSFTFQEGEEDRLEPLLAKFKNYCNPKKNLTVTRNIFHTRHQRSGESVDQYVTDLKALARNCEFRDLEEDLIKDQLVLGINSERVKERLLRENDLSLEKAIEHCPGQ